MWGVARVGSGYSSGIQASMDHKRLFLILSLNCSKLGTRIRVPILAPVMPLTSLKRTSAQHSGRKDSNNKNPIASKEIETSLFASCGNSYRPSYELVGFPYTQEQSVLLLRDL